ncbi:MAG TPA: DUF2207 domain-containing protein [Lysobacter sp.]|nr:DUF2207 domain-containing protein [Lysobacter sp.]
MSALSMLVLLKPALLKSGMLKLGAPRAVVALLLAVVLWPATAVAQERILAFDSDIRIHADGSMDVVETIRVRAEGRQIRRGIYRDFPTRYQDRAGNRVMVDFKLLGVERDGRPEPDFTERIGNGVRINTGGDAFLPVPADITYTIRYRTSRQLGFFDSHDELYWNATGLGWAFPIEQATARVHLPRPVPASQLKTEAYTGRSGSKRMEYQALVNDAGVAEYRATRVLKPGEGITIVLAFPKGIVAAPGTMQRLGWLLKDNRGVLIALIGLVGLVVFYLRRWHRLGRDPAPGSIFPQYEPPEGWSPAELRFLRRMGYDNRCFSADLVDMAVHGGLSIHNEGKKDWQLKREAAGDIAGLSAAQRELEQKLFSAGDELILTDRNAGVIGGARLDHQRAVMKRLKPDYYVSNAGTLGLGVMASVAYGVLAFVVSGGGGVFLIAGLLVLAVGAHIAAGYLMPAPTAKGRALLDRVEGLRLYLGVAERDELRSMQAPGEAPTLDAQRYEALLPYALALDVEDAWTAKFTAAVGVAAAAAAVGAMHWYRSSSSLASLGDMNRALGSTLSQQISSSATPPGSSSGSGGGGSSGGGGGGGGGGGR